MSNTKPDDQSTRQSQSPFDEALPDDVLAEVGDIEVVGRWTADQVNNFQVYAGVQDKRYKLKRAIRIWEDFYGAERSMRKTFALWVFIALGTEILFGVAAFFCLGFGVIHLNQWIADVFFVGVFSQVAAMAIQIVKSLFPTPKKDPLSQINDIVSKL